MKLNVNHEEWIYRHILLFTICSLVLFLFLTCLVTSDTIDSVDSLIHRNISRLYTPAFGKAMSIVSKITHPVVLITVSFILMTFFIVFSKTVKGMVMISGVMVSYYLSSWVKDIFGRSRPESEIIDKAGFSFPSGQAVTSATFFFLVIYLFAGSFTKKSSKMFFIFSNIFLLLLVGLSRIYLQLHWVSDVLAGFALGMVIDAALLLIVKLTSPRELHRF